MFCTTLRRRPSFAAAIPSLQDVNGLALRESRLDTHDLILPLHPTANPTTDNMTVMRHYRFLLLTPSSVADDAKLDEILKRVHHFASLTGGQDLAIIFLLSPPKGGSFVSAKAINSSTNDESEGVKGVHAFTRLQATLVDHSEIPYLPMLPLSTLSTLPDLLHRYTTAVARPSPRPIMPQPSNFSLLQLCTAAPAGRMAEQTAYIVSDIFPDLASLAAACAAEGSSAARSSSPSQRAAASMGRGIGESASQIESELGREDWQDGEGRAAQELSELRALVGEQEYRDLIDYWIEEWTVD